MSAESAGDRVEEPTFRLSLPKGTSFAELAELVPHLGPKSLLRFHIEPNGDGSIAESHDAARKLVCQVLQAAGLAITEDQISCDGPNLDFASPRAIQGVISSRPLTTALQDTSLNCQGTCIPNKAKCSCITLAPGVSDFSSVQALRRARQRANERAAAEKDGGYEDDEDQMYF